MPLSFGLILTSNQYIPVSESLSWEGIFRGVIGILTILVIAVLLSNNRKKINWKLVGIGILLQFVLAVLILQGKNIGFSAFGYNFNFGFVRELFQLGGKIFTKILSFTEKGSVFLLGDLMNTKSYGFIFAFQVLPIIIFFSALTSVLFYLGVIQFFVKSFAKVLGKFLKISGTESLAVSGNIFLGQTEAPLMIKSYLKDMSASELFLVMSAGMATVAGSVLAAYISFLGGSDVSLQQFYAQHLLTASVMAAPGAIVIAKIIFPQDGTINKELKVSKQDIGSNLIEVLSIGTSDGLKLAVNVAAMLLVFISMIALINYTMGFVGGIQFSESYYTLNELIYIKTNGMYRTLSLEYILGTVFSPLMYAIGVASDDSKLMGQLLGIKLVASEFVAYIELAKLKTLTNPVHFTYQKSVLMATYMLCGFANFASIGIQVGGIGSLAPNQRTNLSKLGIKAMIAGALASILSATLVGMLLN
ncbi:MAG: Na+ dependent nucleoside transporter [Flavobacteriales bacterium]|nr:Na+ dependent nucleoside transporter [Flavobacteriales bacterium]